MSNKPVVKLNVLELNERQALNYLRNLGGNRNNYYHENRRNIHSPPPAVNSNRKFIGILKPLPGRVDQKIFIAAVKHKFKRCTFVKLKGRIAFMYFKNQNDLNWALDKKNCDFTFNNVAMRLVPIQQSRREFGTRNESPANDNLVTTESNDLNKNSVAHNDITVPVTSANNVAMNPPNISNRLPELLHNTVPSTSAVAATAIATSSVVSLSSNGSNSSASPFGTNAVSNTNSMANMSTSATYMHHGGIPVSIPFVQLSKVNSNMLVNIPNNDLIINAVPHNDSINNVNNANNEAMDVSEEDGMLSDEYKEIGSNKDDVLKNVFSKKSSRKNHHHRK